MEVYGLGDDRIEGAKGFSREIFGNESKEAVRKTFHLLENGLVPAGKEGATWVGSRKRIREHYAKLTGGAAA